MYGVILLLAGLLPAALAVLAWRLRGRRPRSLRERRNGEQRFSDLVEHLPGFAYRCRNTPDWPLELVSEPVREVTGYTAQELLAGNPVRFGDLIHPDDRERVWQTIQAALEERRTFELDYRLLARSGDVREVWEHGRGLFGPDGAVLLEGFIMDVTSEHRLAREREQLIRELRAERRWLDSVLDHLPAGILLADASGHLARSNAAVERILRHPLRPSSTADEYAGFGAYHADGRRLELREWPLVRALAGEEVCGEDYLYQRGDGTRGWIRAFAAPVFADGVALGAVITLFDVDREKRIDEERERLLRRAEEAIRSRDDFIAIASHELKTPIASLTLQTGGLARLVRRGETIEPARLLERLEVMERQADRLTTLVNTLLDVSRVTREGPPVEPQRGDLAALVRDVVARWEGSFSRARSSSRVRLPLRLMAVFDAGRIEQVLENLMSNAIKYGAGRPIFVELVDEGEYARLTVRDQGIGVAEADQARIFERFERAVPSRHYGGLGLGLWISRQLVEAMGGHIAVESRPGAGAAFHVWLPRGKAARIEPQLGL